MRVNGERVTMEYKVVEQSRFGVGLRLSEKLTAAPRCHRTCAAYGIIVLCGARRIVRTSSQVAAVVSNCAEEYGSRPGSGRQQSS